MNLCHCSSLILQIRACFCVYLWTKHAQAWIHILSESEATRVNHLYTERLLFFFFWCQVLTHSPMITLSDEMSIGETKHDIQLPHRGKRDRATLNNLDSHIFRYSPPIYGEYFLMRPCWKPIACGAVLLLFSACVRPFNEAKIKSQVRPCKSWAIWAGHSGTATNFWLNSGITAPFVLSSAPTNYNTTMVYPPIQQPGQDREPRDLTGSVGTWDQFQFASGCLPIIFLYHVWICMILHTFLQSNMAMDKALFSNITVASSKKGSPTASHCLVWLPDVHCWP